MSNDNEQTIKSMISVIMEMADATTDRGLKRYLFNAIDHLGAAQLYILQYDEALDLREFWAKHQYNEKL